MPIFFVFVDCGCDLQGSTSFECDENGQCSCKTNLIEGAKCDKCLDAMIGFPYCAGNLYFLDSSPLFRCNVLQIYLGNTLH